MKIRIVLLLWLSLISSLASAQEARKPEWISVLDLYGRYIESSDIAYLYNASFRCGAFYNVFSALIERDRGAEAAADMKTAQFLYVYIGFLLGEDKKGIDINSISEDVVGEGMLTATSSAMYQAQVENYIDWLNFSYVNFGEYTGEPDLLKELQTCQNEVMLTLSEYVTSNLE